MCGIDWPREPVYRVCPSCEEKTSFITNADALPDDEARRMKANFEFERFYEQWDSEHDPARLEPDLECEPL